MRVLPPLSWASNSEAVMQGRASAFPSSGEWNDDEFDVRAERHLFPAP